MKPLVAWVTALPHRYQTSVFYSTWVNIVVFHSFFVLVMVVVFHYALNYTELTIMSTFSDLLSQAIAGEAPNPNILSETSSEIEKVSLYISVGMFLMAVVVGIIAANLTLAPTRKALAMQKKFISGVAHELRTPLAILRTNNEVALYDMPPHSPYREVIEENIAETQYLKNVLNNLLVFNRVDMSETMPFSEVKLEEVVNEVVKRLEKYAARQNIKVFTGFEPTPPIRANQTAIEQAIHNVLKNAINYSKTDSNDVQITVTQPAPEKVRVSVSDKGVGIPEDKLPHIFSPFYRVSEGRSESGSMGLGLALVYEIVKLHSGSIRVESKGGEGTTFHLTFPTAIRYPRPEETAADRDSLSFDFSGPTTR